MDYIEQLQLSMLQEGCSQEYIDRCCTYASRLFQENLPVFFDVNHIKQVFSLGGINICAYSIFGVKGKNKIREIHAPSRRLKNIQRWMLDYIFEKFPVSKHAHGFVKGRSIVTNAQTHVNQSHMLNIDIKDFFPSISEVQVADLFFSFGYTKEVSGFLAQLCCHQGCLPQGAPTSPYIANLIMLPADKMLADLAHSFGCKYSRYADDITFSGDSDMTEILAEITTVLNSYDFRINHSKTRIMGEDQVKKVTGLVVSDRVRVPKKFKRELVKELYYCNKFGAFRHLENIKATQYVNFQEHIYGKIYFVHMVEPDVGRKLLEQARAVRWT